MAAGRLRSLPGLRSLLVLLALVLSPPAWAQRAGTLVSATPAADAPATMRAWRIAYRTADEDGRPIIVTGMVVAPRGSPPAGPRKVIAWTHGAWGVVDRCAPSITERFFTATPPLAQMIARGYLVVAPDYPGLGNNQITHGFLVGRETAHSVLDAVRAAQAIPGAAAGSRFAVWGESQGGHAALWTASEAARYAPELRLVGTAAAAPPTALADNFRLGSDPNARALLTAFALYSWSQRFGAPLQTVLNRVNQGVATRLAANNCISLDTRPKLGTILGVASLRQNLVGKDIGAITPWSGIARTNSVDAARVPGPLLIAQGGKDVLVAPSVTLAFARRACAAGKRVQYIFVPEMEHARSARDTTTPTLDWIDARFAGKAPPTSCGKI